MFQCARCEQNTARDKAYESNVAGEDAICWDCYLKTPIVVGKTIPLVKADPSSMRPPVAKRSAPRSGAPRQSRVADEVKRNGSDSRSWGKLVLKAVLVAAAAALAIVAAIFVFKLIAAGVMWVVHIAANIVTYGLIFLAIAAVVKIFSVFTGGSGGGGGAATSMPRQSSSTYNYAMQRRVLENELRHREQLIKNDARKTAASAVHRAKGGWFV